MKMCDKQSCVVHPLAERLMLIAFLSARAMFCIISSRVMHCLCDVVNESFFYGEFFSFANSCFYVLIEWIRFCARGRNFHSDRSIGYRVIINFVLKDSFEFD